MVRCFLVIYCLLPFFVFSQKIDLRFLTDNDASKGFVKENNLNTYKIYYQQFFVTNEKVDYEKLEKLLEKSFPSKTSSGMLVLDWEGKGMDVLVKQDDKKKLAYYKSEYIKALTYVKKKRPNVKVGFYAIPFRQYWGIGDTFISKNNNLIDIIKKQDFIAPSLYTFYIDTQNLKGNHEYINKNLDYALKLGQQLNKPVYPFIWHRVHPSNKKAGNELIPVDFFKNSIKDILSVKYNGKTIKGLFWWHSEDYSYRTRKSSKVISQEYKNINNIYSYQKNIYQNYYDSFKNNL